MNVGAVVGSEESSEWAVRQVDNPLRARHLDERGTLPAVFAFIDRVGREIDAYEEIIVRGGLGRLSPLFRRSGSRRSIAGTRTSSSCRSPCLYSPNRSTRRLR